MCSLRLPGKEHSIMTEKKHMTMKDMPVSERPYEKCEKLGPSALSDAELLAIILKTGQKGKKVLDTAYELLQLDEAHPGLEGLLRADISRLQAVSGIGRVKAISLAAVLELSVRLSRLPFHDGFIFDSAAKVADYYLHQMRLSQQEELHVMMLDSKNSLIRERMISLGSVKSAMVDPRGIYIEAIRCEAVGIIIIHNHPSGDPSPSSEDISATMRIAEAGKLLDIPLIDHIIIGNQTYTSMREQGCIF